MGRYYDVVGYVYNEETSPGVYSGVVIDERRYFGEVKNISHRWEKGEGLNDDITVNQEISIMADAFAYSHFASIKYLRWMGAYWKVASVRVERPRLIFSLGGVYNGPTKGIAETP